MGCFLFSRPHHQAIASVLEALSADFLAENHCYFGGGTAMALRYGEYRESVDIDFMVADPEGYRMLRHAITSTDSLACLCRKDHALTLSREIRTGQYNIQTAVIAANTVIKFEIVREARIDFIPPGDDDRICGIGTLTPLDLMSSKLLANCDRWADDAAFSRDLIDLAMMARPKLLPAALAKAEGAYGDTVRRDLRRAIDAMLSRVGWAEKCMRAMRMETPKALLWNRIRTLAESLQHIRG